MPDTKPSRLTFESRDGFVLNGEWHPYASDTPSHHAALVAPGMGIPARFYRAFARHLAKRGIDVLLFDYRGIGWSGVDKLSGLNADATCCGRVDLAAAIDHLNALSGGKQLVGIGHSFGGSIFGLADNISSLNKMVHLCSQSGYFGYYPAKTKLYMLFNIRIAMPVLTRLLGYYPAHWLSGSEALPAGFVREWSDWCLREEYFMSHRFDVRTSGHHAKYQGALLSLSFDDDSFATQESVDAMASFYNNSRLERRHLSPGDFNTHSLGHFDLFKPLNGRVLWDAVAEWILTSDRATLSAVSSKYSR